MDPSHNPVELQLRTQKVCLLFFLKDYSAITLLPLQLQELQLPLPLRGLPKPCQAL